MATLKRVLGSPWLLAVAAALLGLALAVPRLSLPGASWNHVVVVDITQSMNAVDMPWQRASVSRLEFVRRSLHEAAAALPCGSRLGLGVFTEYRSLLLLTPVEVCSNYDELLAVIDRIDGRMAWAGASEVSRGVFSAMAVVGALPGSPSLVFVSDGHEAPPRRPDADVAPEHRPPNLRGVLAGVGGDAPVPIPKFDVDGHRIGVWEADEVMQTDPFSLGRTVGGARQSLVDSDGKPVQALAGSGIEHLSSLKEAHLRALSQGTGLAFRRVDSSAALTAVLRDPALAQTVTAERDVRAVPTALALLLLAAAVLPLPRGTRRLNRGGGATPAG
jgi:mxaL protein